MSINPAPCAFEKALLTQCADCVSAERHLLAEREMVSCSDAQARQDCMDLKLVLRTHLAFVLKWPHPDEAAPHGKEVRAQCGGLQGLAHELGWATEIQDVRALLCSALAQYGRLDALPYAGIVPFVTRYKTRHRD